MKDFIKTNLDRLSELRDEVAQEEQKLREAEASFRSVKQRYLNLWRFLKDEIVAEQDKQASKELREITGSDENAGPQQTLFEQSWSKINKNLVARSASSVNRLSPNLEDQPFETKQLSPVFNKTRFIVEIWAAKNAAGDGTTPRQLFEIVQTTEAAGEITLAYVHNTFSRFKKSGRAEQRDDGNYYLTKTGIDYLEGMDA